MSDLANRTRDQRRGWARPRSRHDRLVKTLAVLLPAAIGLLALVLLVAPLLSRKESSFVLDKDRVEVAQERLKVSEALYRGEDDKGRPFSLQAGSAIQQSSKVPVVRLSEMSARLSLDEGPAVLRAPSAQYDMADKQVLVDGPLLYQSSDGYRLTTRDVAVDLGSRTIASSRPVEGRMPLGTFSADRLRADLEKRTVTLEGHARLHIVQGAAKGR